MNVLIVEDDHSVVGALSAVLLHHGYQVRVARTAREAVERMSAETDVVLLDLGLPDRDGLQVCKRLREMGDAAIIIVTARDDLRSRVHGLDLGADDYIVKPYASSELLARINAVVRRRDRPAERPSEPPAPADDEITVGQLRIDFARRTVEVAGRPVELTRREFDIVRLLARYPSVVVRYEQIISELWETSSSTVMRTLQVHVGAIRSKFAPVDVIDTVREVGYRLRDH